MPTVIASWMHLGKTRKPTEAHPSNLTEIGQ